MAFSFIGAITDERIATGDPVSLTLTDDVAAGDVVVLVAATDDNSRSVSSVTDSGGHSYTSVASVNSNGTSVIAYARASSGLDAGDTISLNWSSSADTVAQAFAMRGITVPNVGSDTDAYDTGFTYAQSVTASDDGVQIVCFGFGFDYLFGGVTISGWSKLCEIDDTPDQSMQAYYKEVSAGSNTATKTIGTDVGHVSCGVVLPYEEVAAVARPSTVMMVGW